jgi:hypothetical protein
MSNAAAVERADSSAITNNATIFLISQVPGNLLAFEFPQKRLCFTFDELYCLTHSIAGFPIALSTSLRFGLVAKFSRLLL